MNVVKCDLCGVTSDERMPLGESRDWRSLSIKRARGWEPGFVPIGGNAMREAADTWPGSSRWHPTSYPGGVLELHLCSAGCMFSALSKLHDGSVVSAFSGFTIPTESLLALIREKAVADVASGLRASSASAEDVGVGNEPKSGATS